MPFILCESVDSIEAAMRIISEGTADSIAIQVGIGLWFILFDYARFPLKDCFIFFLSLAV